MNKKLKNSRERGGDSIEEIVTYILCLFVTFWMCSI